MSHDPRSSMVLIAASAVIATAGLLVDSFAVVVGSMVIAPLVGPVMTAVVGAATGDRAMVVDIVWLQAAGLGLAVVAAAAFSLGLRASGFVPGGLDVTRLESVAVRIAPGLLSVAFAAGAASAFGLATKGPTALIGVMIAAALIPAAAAAGVAAAWVERPEDRWLRRPSASTRRRLAVFGTTVIVLALVVAVVAGSYQQIYYERTINQEVERLLASPEYEAVAPVTVRIEYAGAGPFASPETVTVVASRTTDGESPPVAGAMAERIRAATGEDVSVRVRFLEYQDSTAGGGRQARPAFSPAVGRAAPSRPRLPAPGGAGAGSRRGSSPQ